jgi:hypothetical protein
VGRARPTRCDPSSDPMMVEISERSSCITGIADGSVRVFPVGMAQPGCSDYDTDMEKRRLRRVPSRVLILPAATLAALVCEASLVLAIAHHTSVRLQPVNAAIQRLEV